MSKGIHVVKLSMIMLSVAFTIGSVPMHEDTQLFTHTRVELYGWYNGGPFQDYFSTHYITKFQVYPNSVIWTNVPVDSVALHFGFSVRPTLAYVDWSPTPTWNELKHHIALISLNRSTGTSDTLTAAAFSFPGEVGVDPDGQDYAAGITINAQDLSLPQLDTVYEVWTEVWDEVGNPATKITASYVDTVTIIRSPIDSPTDSLQWMMNNVSITNIEYFRSMLRHYPDNYAIMNSIFRHYYSVDPNCDSLQYYGDKMIIKIKAGEVINYFGWSTEAIIESMIEDVCEDGVPNPTSLPTFE